MFINDDNNRDNCNYPIGERDYLYECETSYIRYKCNNKLLVHSETYLYTDEMHYIVTKYLDIYYI